MKRLQSKIPIAIEAAKSLRENEKIPSEMNGYISSFGASMISAGILPTLIFFSQKGGSSAGREKIIPAIEEILNYKLDETNKIKLLEKVQSLFNPVSNTNGINYSEIDKLTAQLNDACLLLKLAIRTFPKSK